jgi:broad specificity phosphatase PhoE
MILYIIRHGESTGDIEDRYGGSYDDHLSPRGKEQARALGEELKGRGIQKIYHSPYHRARETAARLNESLDLEMIEVKDIRERNYCGILSGMVKRQAREKHPEYAAALDSMPIDPGVPGSEDYAAFSRRIDAALAGIIALGGAAVAIVTHGGPIYHLFRTRFGKEPRHIADCAYAIVQASSEMQLMSSVGIDFAKAKTS